MNSEDIKKLCLQKEQELITKYFGNLVKEAAYEQPETLEGYHDSLPQQIKDEYHEFLRDLWSKIAPNDKRSLEDILDKQRESKLITDNERETVKLAYNEATKQTLWERLSRTNHKDIIFYKGLLKDYTQELLFWTRHDFLEEALQRAS